MYLNFLCLNCGLEVRLEDDFVVHGVLLVSLRDHRVDSKRQSDVIGGPISHQFELAIWRNETDRALRLKLAQFHTLVECAVIDGYACFCGCPVNTKRAKLTHFRVAVSENSSPD